MSIDVAANDGADRSGLSIEKRRRSARRAWRISGLIVPLLFAVVVFATLVVALAIHHNRNGTPVIEPRLHDGLGLLDKMKSVVTGNEARSEEPSSDAAFISVNTKLRGLTFQLNVAQTKQAIRHLESAKNEWEGLVKRTLHDAVGKRIAGNELDVMRFIVLREMPEPKQVTLDFRANLKALERDAEASPDLGVADDLSTTAVGIKENALTVFKFHQGRVNAINKLRRDVADLPMNALDLAIVLKHRDTNLATQRQAAAAAASHKLETKMNGKLEEMRNQRDGGIALVAELKKGLGRVESGEPPRPLAAVLQMSRLFRLRNLGEIDSSFGFALLAVVRFRVAVSLFVFLSVPVDY